VADWTSKRNLAHRAASMEEVGGYGGVLGRVGVVGIESVAKIG
jgi:hypothetical protein